MYPKIKHEKVCGHTQNFVEHYNFSGSVFRLISTDQNKYYLRIICARGNAVYCSLNLGHVSSLNTTFHHVDFVKTNRATSRIAVSSLHERSRKPACPQVAERPDLSQAQQVFTKSRWWNMALTQSKYGLRQS